MYFIFKHSGIILIYIVFSFFITIGYELGINYKQIKENNQNSFEYTDKSDATSTMSNTKFDIIRSNKCNSYIITLEENIIIDIKKKLNLFIKTYKNDKNSFEIEYENINSIINNNYNKMSTSFLQHSNFYSDDIDFINKKIKTIYNYYVKYFFIYIIFMIILILVSLIYIKQKKDDVQEYNGKWRYTCSLTKMNLVMNSLEFFLLLYLLLKSLRMWNYIFIFKFYKNIGYSLFIWITLGPLINVILHYY